MNDYNDQKLRILIVTENFLPKVDGVTRTLSRLLEHLQAQGHEALLLGPHSDMCASSCSHALTFTLLTMCVSFLAQPMPGTTL